MNDPLTWLALAAVGALGLGELLMAIGVGHELRTGRPDAPAETEQADRR